jgi:hypothetical protein
MLSLDRVYVHLAEGKGAHFRRDGKTGHWFANDKDGTVIVPEAMSLAEAARLFCEDQGLIQSDAEFLAQIVAKYQPYDTLPAFGEGFAAYQRDGAFRVNPYRGADGPQAQAWEPWRQCRGALSAGAGALGGCSGGCRHGDEEGELARPAPPDREVLTVTMMSAEHLKKLIVRTRVRFREIDHADWDGFRYGSSTTAKWEQAAKETAPPEWCEYVRILAQGWDYYGGSDLPGEGRV